MSEWRTREAVRAFTVDETELTKRSGRARAGVVRDLLAGIQFGDQTKRTAR